MRILVTGGCGFVGASLALGFKRDRGNAEVLALDNLRRRGSELALPRLKKGGVVFVHGDIRNPEDLAQVPKVGLLVECSAEPSVMAGYDGATAYMFNTNLAGTVNCLEYAARWGSDIIFMSTSRIYAIEALRGLPLITSPTRFEIEEGASGPGWSKSGITVDFPVLTGVRSLYGASKLCSELLISEYAAIYGLRAIINRCGVVSGPWQMGKVDQGFVVHWCARHFYGGHLAYKGFEGRGFQVRDVLHLQDLYELLCLQLSDINRHNGKTYNVGAGRNFSVSLRELTDMCRVVSGNRIDIESQPETHPSDIPYYVTDNTLISEHTGWFPKRSVNHTVEDIFQWLRQNSRDLETVFA